MKKRLSLVATGALALSLAWVAPVQANDQLIANICQYVQADNKTRLRKKLKESRIKVRTIYDGIKCNGESMIRSAMANNADGVGVFLVKKLSAAQLKAKEQDGQSVLEWASAHGHGDSTIVSAINDRIGG